MVFIGPFEFRVSREDEARIRWTNWCQNNCGYWRSCRSYPDTKRQILLHRYLVGERNIPDGYQCDHRDKNPSNNCRGNLRILTKSANQRNRSRNYALASGAGYRNQWSDENGNQCTRYFSVNKYGWVGANILCAIVECTVVRPLYDGIIAAGTHHFEWVTI